MNNIILGAFLVVFTLFAVTLLFQLNMFKIAQKRPYSFRNELPFELTEGTPARHYHFQYVLHGLISLAMLVYGVAFVFRFNHIRYYYDYMILSGLVISAFTYFFVFFFKINNLKGHILVLLFYVFALFTAFLGFGLSLYLSPYELLTNENLKLVFTVINFVSAAVILLLMFNPKLARWPMMDKITQQDGTLIILRPKTFILALYEWLFVGIHLLFILLSFVTLFF